MPTENPGRLPSVPMQIPIPGFTLEEYLQYRSWRIEVQMVAARLNEWRQAKGVDKEKYKATILTALETANKRAQKFPATELPNDIEDPVISAHLDLPSILQELTAIFGSVQLAARTKVD